MRSNGAGGRRRTAARGARRPGAVASTHKARLLTKLAAGWAAFQESYAGLSRSRLTERGVTGDWSVKDILAHVTTWEGEALKHLPVILAGGRPPRYVVQYGGIDAFNARMTREKRRLALVEVLRQLDRTHGRLVRFVRRIPDVRFAREPRAGRRLRLDTYGHYPEHARAIRAWRARVAAPGARPANRPAQRLGDR